METYIKFFYDYVFILFFQISDIFLLNQNILIQFSNRFDNMISNETYWMQYYNTFVQFSLQEAESCHLLEQIVNTVSHCHSRSIVLRDLKLRKFVFTDPERFVNTHTYTQL